MLKEKENKCHSCGLMRWYWTPLHHTQWCSGVISLSQYVIFLMVYSLQCLYVSSFLWFKRHLSGKQNCPSVCVMTTKKACICVFLVYSQERSTVLSVKFLSKFRTPHSKSSTDVWPRAVWQTYSWHGMVIWKWRDQSGVYGESFRGVYVKLLTISVTLQREKNIQSLTVFLLWYIIPKTKQVGIAHCRCVSVCFIGYGVCHKHRNS